MLLFGLEVEGAVLLWKGKQNKTQTKLSLSLTKKRKKELHSHKTVRGTSLAPAASACLACNPRIASTYLSSTSRTTASLG